MAQIDSLSLKITASSADASKKLKELSDALKVFRSSSNITTATNNLSKLSTALTSLNRLRVMPEKYRQIGEGIQSINSSISQISLASVNRVERLATALEKLGKVRGINASVRKALGDLALPSEEAQNSEEIVKKTENVEDVANRASTAFSRFKSELKGIKNYAAISGLNSLKSSFDGLKTAIHRALSPLKHFLSSIGRIALYRAIRSAIKTVSAGIKEGLQNLAMFSYQMKELDTHKANKVLSLYTSNFLYLKNAIATAVIPVLKMLEPIIDSVINRMVDFINIIAQLGSFLSGSTTYTRAKYYYKDYAESLDKASGSAAKLNKQLAKFDEINNITFKEGSGSGKNIDDYLQMFEDPIPIADWIQNLKNKDWYEIGKTIADKFSDSLENINWDNVKSKASNIAKKFASFLNGVFTPRTFKNVAKTIAQSLNTALLTVKVFGENFDAKQLGNGIIKGITTFFETFDFGLLADTLNVFKDKFFDFIKGIFDGLKESDWKKIFSNMFEFFKHIEPDTVGLVLGAILVTKGSKFAISYGAGFIEGIAKAISSQITTITLGKLTIDSASEISLLGLGASIGEIILTGLAGYLIGNRLMQIVGFIKGAFTGDFSNYELYKNADPISAFDDTFNKWSPTVKGGQLVGTMIGNSSPFQSALKKGKIDENSTLFEMGKAMGEEIILGIVAGIGAKIKKITSFPAVLTTFLSAFKTTFDSHSPAKKMYPIGEDVILGVIKGFYLVNFGQEMAKWWTENVSPWFTVERWRGVADGVRAGIISKWNETVISWSGKVSAWWTNNVSPWFTLDRWKTVADGIRAGLVAKWNEIALWWQGAINGIVTKAKNILNYDSFYSIGSKIGSGLKNAFSSFINEMERLWKGLKDTVSTGLSLTIKVGVNDNGFNSALANWQNKVSGLIEAVGQLHLGDVQPTDLGTTTDPHGKGGGTGSTTTTGSGLKSGDVNLASGFRNASDSVKEAAAKASLPEEVRKKIYGYATGGFPKVGSLFVAHERGPELVGSFEGKTGVANQGQITEAMYDATYKAMSKALSENSTTGRIEVDENAFFRFIQQKANEYFNSTGNKPFPA